MQIQQLTDWLNDQAWFQEIKSKWNELDDDSKKLTKFGSAAAGALFVFYLLFSVLSSTYALKGELVEKKELLQLIESANIEARDLKKIGSQLNSDQKTDWTKYFETVAGRAGVNPGNIKVQALNKGKKRKKTEEGLYKVELKGVNIKQVVRYAYYVETQSSSVKVRNLFIKTVGDQGFLEAGLDLSAFDLIKER